jgi:hypothetical protein
MHVIFKVVIIVEFDPHIIDDVLTPLARPVVHLVWKGRLFKNDCSVGKEVEEIL